MVLVWLGKMCLVWRDICRRLEELFSNVTVHLTDEGEHVELQEWHTLKQRYEEEIIGLRRQLQEAATRSLNEARLPAPPLQYYSI